MSWTLAHAKNVSLVEGVTGLLKKGGAPAKFKHYPEASKKKPCGERGFWFEFTRGSMKGHVTYAPPRWFHYPTDLVIVYAAREPTLLMELIASDHQALAGVLPDQGLFDGANSTIESLYVEDGPEIMTFDIEEGDGVVFVHHHMFWEFRPSTP